MTRDRDRRSCKRRLNLMQEPHLQQTQPPCTLGEIAFQGQRGAPAASALMQQTEHIRQTLDLRSDLPVPTALHEANSIMGIPNDEHAPPFPDVAARLIQELGI